MWQSLRISHLLLRVSIACAFLWFGIDKFFHPDVWINAGVPQSLIHLAGFFHISANAIIYTLGVLELLIGISLGSAMFVESFAVIGAALLISTPFFYGFNEAFVRDLGLIGGLLALIFWPHQRFRNY
jgi:uncharacterized membrane protein YphA (DoxX/SURF4 family)